MLQEGAELRIVGLSPTLDLRPKDGKPFCGGWVLLRLRVCSQATHHSFFLYPSVAVDEHGEPVYSGDRRVWVTAQSGELHEQLVHLPAEVCGLRLDPFETEGVFSFERLELCELGSLQVAQAVIGKQLRGGLANPSLVWRKARKLFAVLREGGITGLRIKLFADNITNNYQEWVRRFDTLSAQDQQLIRADVERFARRPLISVVMPTYNTPERWLRAAIESVRAQLYPNWELCIADDASSDPAVRRVLEEYASKDERIRVAFRDQNGHISAASNSALELARGEFIALLDHDDELTPHALYMVARTINEHPDADMFYSDEDKITSFGMRFNPYFKSDWNPELFLAQNFVCHLGVYRTSLVREVGGFRTGVEGAQDWDLAWRVADRCGPEKIRHIPHVLYHWRVIESSTASSTLAKPYVLQAQVAAVRAHLERAGLADAAVEVLHDISQLRVRFPLPEPRPLVSIIIPTRDQVQYLERCIESIERDTRYREFEILVVDNGSVARETFAYFEKLAARSHVRVLRDEQPFNFSRLNNMAVREAKGTLLAFLNNDLEVISPEWLDEMVRYAVLPEVGAVGARLWYPNDLLQHAGVVLGIGGVAGHNHKGIRRGDPGYFNRAILPQNLCAVTAACLVVRREVFEQVGGFDEQELSVAFNDVDLCLRIHAAGFRNVYTPYAELYHHESVSRGYETTPEKFSRFEGEIATMKRRWSKLLQNDPYYNPNLTVLTEDFAFAFPPRVEKPWRRSAG